MIERVAPTDATVLVWGENGVDRERVARTLHECSPRRGQPFVTVNCASLPLELLESEIFGYGQGAFTGAHRQKPGKLETAHGGTIFLDEIGEMPPSLQSKLLDVLRDGHFSRLGSRQGIRVDVRVVAAANEDLGQLVLSGRFREDLYRRLNGVSLRLPPLREPAASPTSTPQPASLVGSVVASGPGAQLAPRAANGHRTYEEDGLKGIARRAALEAERAVLKAVLEQVHWNRREASRRLKISYKTLRWKIRQCGLDG